MTILVSGAGGFVGSRIMQAIPEAVICPTLRCATQKQIDEYIDTFQPDVIIHTAAISDIGICEKCPDASYRANVALPVMLAKAAKKAKLIIFSSDQVYNGCDSKGPYSETDILSPVNVYGRHKLEMEQNVLDISPDAILLRAEWMYDMTVYRGVNRGNFLINVIKAAMSNREILFSKGQYRGLTYLREVAQNMKKLITVPGGVYNFGSENSFSMYDTAEFLLQELGADTHLLHDTPNRHNLWMDCSKLTSCGVVFNSTLDGLKQCLSDYELSNDSR